MRKMQVLGAACWKVIGLKNVLDGGKTGSVRMKNAPDPGGDGKQMEFERGN
jgi:hypothetical protein